MKMLQIWDNRRKNLYGNGLELGLEPAAAQRRFWSITGISSSGKGEERKKPKTDTGCEDRALKCQIGFAKCFGESQKGSFSSSGEE